MSWTDDARQHIARIHATLPANATYKDRVKALRDGYPWNRMGWAYKAWLKARGEYLNRYRATRSVYGQANFDNYLSPLDRAKAIGEKYGEKP